MNDDELKNNPQKENNSPALPPESGKGKNKRKRKSSKTHPEPVLTQDVQEGSPPETENSADDDPFAELRRDLKQDEVAEKEKKQKSFVGRITSRLKRSKSVSVEYPVDADVAAGDSTIEEEPAKLIAGADDSPSDEKIASLMGFAEQSKSEPAEDDVAVLSPEQDVEDFILNLEPSALTPAAVQKEELTGPVHEEQIEESIKEADVLKHSHKHYEDDKRDEALREVALEDYGKAPEADETKTQTLSQRLKIVRKGLKPVERLLIVGVAGLFIITCLFASGAFLFSRFSQGDQAPPAPTQDLPFPVRLTLAGSGYFDLDRGTVENGKWKLKNKNQGMGEWLDGTELCKWVAIPWNVQLEAVVRSLTPRDTIDLTMSNADVLTYKVYSIQSVPVDQIESLEKIGRCLLVILANEDADTRWVVTAIP